MKKTIILLSILLTCKLSYTQSFKAGFLGGLCASQVSGDNYSGFNKPGFVFGGFTSLPLKNGKSEIGFEILYIQKGSRHYPNPNKFDYTDYKISLSYIEVPLIFTYHVPLKGLSAEIGSAYARLISQKEVLNELKYSNPFNNTEIDFLFGFKYLISEKMEISFRNYTTWFFTPIRSHSGNGKYRFNWGQYNNGISLALRYNFGK